MESHDVNPDEDQTGKHHANTLEKIFNEMMAANWISECKVQRILQKKETADLDLNAALQTIIAQTLERGERNCKYSDVYRITCRVKD